VASFGHANAERLSASVTKQGGFAPRPSTGRGCDGIGLAYVVGSLHDAVLQ